MKVNHNVKLTLTYQFNGVPWADLIRTVYQGPDIIRIAESSNVRGQNLQRNEIS
jgi:hypothetical protein